MGDALSLDELKTYAEADSVKSFYYTMTAYVNGTDDFEAYSTSDDDDSSAMGFPGGMGGFSGGMSSGDFTVTGFSSDESMTEFVNGTCEITEGAVFDENTSEMVCIIPDELADSGKCVVLVTHSSYVAGQADEVIELAKVNKAKA